MNSKVSASPTQFVFLNQNEKKMNEKDVKNLKLQSY